MDGRFFGFLALENTINGGKKHERTKTGSLGPSASVYICAQTHGVTWLKRRKRQICVSTLFGTLCDIIPYYRFSTIRQKHLETRYDFGCTQNNETSPGSVGLLPLKEMRNLAALGLRPDE